MQRHTLTVAHSPSWAFFTSHCYPRFFASLLVSSLLFLSSSCLELLFSSFLFSCSLFTSLVFPLALRCASLQSSRKGPPPAQPSPSSFTDGTELVGLGSQQALTLSGVCTQYKSLCTSTCTSKKLTCTSKKLCSCLRCFLSGMCTGYKSHIHDSTPGPPQRTRGPARAPNPGG